MSVACENRDADIYRVCDLKIEPVANLMTIVSYRVVDSEGNEWFTGSHKECQNYILIGE